MKPKYTEGPKAQENFEEGMKALFKVPKDEVVKAETVCPKCGSRIPPAEVQRIDFTRVRCPPCGEAFVPGKR
jgi:ribosomal protein S27AE